MHFCLFWYLARSLSSEQHAGASAELQEAPYPIFVSYNSTAQSLQMKWSHLLSPEYFTQVLTKCNNSHAKSILPQRTCQTSELNNFIPQGTTLLQLAMRPNLTNVTLTLPPQDYTIISFDSEGNIMCLFDTMMTLLLYYYSEFGIVLHVQNKSLSLVLNAMEGYTHLKNSKMTW